MQPPLIDFGLNVLATGKDKLEDMDVSLNFPTRRKGPLIFTRQLWPNGWTYFKSKGARWKIWALSFQWCLVVHCRSSGLVTILCQNEVVFDVFHKMPILSLRWEDDFRKLFFKMRSFKDRLAQIHETNFQWPQISQIFRRQNNSSHISNSFWDVPIDSYGPLTHV